MEAGSHASQYYYQQEFFDEGTCELVQVWKAMMQWLVVQTKFGEFELQLIWAKEPLFIDVHHLSSYFMIHHYLILDLSKHLSFAK